MQIKYDADVDAMYIKLSDKPYHKMHRVNDDVNIDLDEDGNVIGIELLYVSTYTEDVQAVIYRYSQKRALAADAPSE